MRNQFQLMIIGILVVFLYCLRICYVFLQIFANPGEHDTKRMLLNMITTSLYLGLPLLWSGMMAWAGVRVGRSIDAATNPLRAPAQDAGRQGGSIGKTAVTKGFKR